MPFQEGNLLAATVWESRSARPGSSPPPASPGSEASTSEAGREEVSVHWSSCGSPGWPRCPVLRADGDLHAPNWEPALEVGRGWGRGGWGQGRAGRQAPGTGRNSCRTLCSQTAAPLRALRPRRQELRPRKPSRAGGWALPLGARPPTTRHAPPPHTPRLHHHSWAPCPGAAWSLGPVQPDRYVAAPVGSARPPCFLQARPAPATKSTSPAPHPHEVPPPHPGRDRPPRQPAGHGTEQTRQTTPSEKQLNLCASAPSAVLRRPLRSFGVLCSMEGLRPREGTNVRLQGLIQNYAIRKVCREIQISARVLMLL